MGDPAELIREVEDNQYESPGRRLSRKLKENPLVGVGLLGMVGACGYGGYLYKNGRIRMPLPQYLMQLRVIAQGTVVASLVAGAAYTMYKHVSSQHPEQRKV